MPKCIRVGRGSAQPAAAEDDCQAKKDGQQGPGDTVEGGFRAARTSEHGAATRGQTTHAITFGAVKQHRNNQDDAAGRPDVAQSGLKHGL